MTDRPVYFTRAAWESLSDQQRDLIRRGRVQRVQDLEALHHARYHAPEELARLVIATHPDGD